MAVVPTSLSVAPGRRSGLLRRVAPGLGAAPFLIYSAVFLLLPTAIVVIGAFRAEDGGFSLVNIKQLSDPSAIDALRNSVVLSLVTAVIGAIVGAVVAYVLTTAAPNGVLRRVVTAASSVLAQFGGALLAFAFIATVGTNGLLSRSLTTVGITIAPDFLSTLGGLIPVYLYFQVPLMVIVFLPAVDGMRIQWREATETLGGSTWAFWRHVGGPLLLPSFLGSTLLLFANAFSAYATAAALISQYNPLIALQIRGAIISETGSGAPNFAKALALVMVFVVAIVMFLYFWLQKRTSRWLR